MAENVLLVEKLTQAYNEVMESGVEPKLWKTSGTVIIPKREKIVARNHRPIALTNVGYNLYL